MVVSNIFFFTPIPGKMIQFDEHIFEMGWNHQLRISVIFQVGWVYPPPPRKGVDRPVYGVVLGTAQDLMESMLAFLVIPLESIKSPCKVEVARPRFVRPSRWMEVVNSCWFVFSHDCTWSLYNPIYIYMSNEKNPGWLGFIGGYTTQLYRDYNKPL